MSKKIKKEHPFNIKKIAVTGGKGGTGKSTVAVLLAADFLRKNKKVVLVDCDVECPNGHLLIGEKLKNPVKKTFINFPELDKKRCKKCGLCVKTCRENAVFQAPGEYPIFSKDLCSGCGACWLVCPNKAIKPKKEESGKIFINSVKKSSAPNKKNDFWLITGAAKPGLEETGPVVGELKNFALDFAKKKKADIILFDTAAGTHCPTITAIMDCDLAYCVTEPTPMGAYDLSLILDLCKKLKVPTELILNQADMGNKKIILPVIKKFNTKIKKEIPWSKEILTLYSKGQLLKLGDKY